MIDVPDPVLEITTVADDLVVAHRGTEVIRLEGLSPDTSYDVEGIAVDTASAIVQRLIGTAPDAGAVKSAVADALKR